MVTFVERFLILKGQASDKEEFCVYYGERVAWCKRIFYFIVEILSLNRWGELARNTISNPNKIYKLKYVYPPPNMQIARKNQRKPFFKFYQVILRKLVP